MAHLLSALQGSRVEEEEGTGVLAVAVPEEGGGRGGAC